MKNISKQRMMDVPGLEVSAKNSKYKVFLSYIGEGRFGDFNKNDPDNEPLLRCDVHTKEEDDKRRWSDEAVISLCVNISARKTVEEVNAIVRKLCTNITEIADDGEPGWDYIVNEAVKKTMALSKDENYINDSMERLGITWGFSEDDVTDKDAEKIRQKAEEIMTKAFEDFDGFLEKLGYERSMGMIVKKVYEPQESEE